MPVNYVTETPFQLFNSAECHLINNYITSARYGFHTTINKQEIVDIINAVKTVYSFSLLQAIRDVFSKQTDYRLLPDIQFTTKSNMGK